MWGKKTVKRCGQKCLYRYCYQVILLQNGGKVIFNFDFILFNSILQTDKNGCATLTFEMSSFTKLDKKAVRDHLDIVTSLEEEGTGATDNVTAFT